MRLKFSAMTLLILTTSLGATSSSVESMTIPKLEYSRMDLASKILVDLSTPGPNK